MPAAHDPGPLNCFFGSLNHSTATLPGLSAVGNQLRQRATGHCVFLHGSVGGGQVRPPRSLHNTDPQRNRSGGRRLLVAARFPCTWQRPQPVNRMLVVHRPHPVRNPAIARVVSHCRIYAQGPRPSRFRWPRQWPHNSRQCGTSIQGASPGYGTSCLHSRPAHMDAQRPLRSWTTACGRCRGLRWTKRTRIIGGPSRTAPHGPPRMGPAAPRSQPHEGGQNTPGSKRGPPQGRPEALRSPPTGSVTKPSGRWRTR